MNPIEISASWVCAVVRTGYHNGSSCTPEEPHDAQWHCGWYFSYRARAAGPGEVLRLLGPGSPVWLVVEETDMETSLPRGVFAHPEEAVEYIQRVAPNASVITGQDGQVEAHVRGGSDWYSYQFLLGKGDSDPALESDESMRAELARLVADDHVLSSGDITRVRYLTRRLLAGG